METNYDRKVKVFIATSADGFIATPDGDISFLSAVEKKGEDYGYSSFIKNIDTVLMGRKTYEKVLTFGIPYPHADKKTFVITRTKKPDEASVTFYTENISELISELKTRPGKDIFVDGGAELINAMMKLNLIDEFIISIIPIFIGGGISLFQPGRPIDKLQLLEARTFETGLVQLHYELKK